VRSGLDVRTFATRRLHACHRARAPSGRRWNCGREMSLKFCLNADFHVTFRDLLHAVKLRHVTDGFTSPPKEGVLRIFFRPKNPTALAGCEPANSGTKGQFATSRPPKPLTNRHSRQQITNQHSVMSEKAVIFFNKDVRTSNHVVPTTIGLLRLTEELCVTLLFAFRANSQPVVKVTVKSPPPPQWETSDALFNHTANTQTVETPVQRV
jgi:hypothetical protein